MDGGLDGLGLDDGCDGGLDGGLIDAGGLDLVDLMVKLMT